MKKSSPAKPRSLSSKPSPFKVYLAGPDVFNIDAAHFFVHAKELASARGLHALSPFDNEVDMTEEDGRSFAIYRGNISLLEACDAVVANLHPFRGPSADAGTVFEVGFAVALKKPVFAYQVPHDSYRYRVHEAMPDPERGPVDQSGMAIENFALFDNLMIAHGVNWRGDTLESALNECARHFALTLDRTG